jgi:hypothetical protein
MMSSADVAILSNSTSCPAQTQAIFEKSRIAMA